MPLGLLILVFLLLLLFANVNITYSNEKSIIKNVVSDLFNKNYSFKGTLCITSSDEDMDWMENLNIGFDGTVNHNHNQYALRSYIQYDRSDYSMEFGTIYKDGNRIIIETPKKEYLYFSTHPHYWGDIENHILSYIEQLNLTTAINRNQSIIITRKNKDLIILTDQYSIQDQGEFLNKIIVPSFLNQTDEPDIPLETTTHFYITRLGDIGQLEFTINYNQLTIKGTIIFDFLSNTTVTIHLTKEPIDLTLMKEEEILNVLYKSFLVDVFY